MRSSELDFMTEKPIGGEIFYDEFLDPNKVWKMLLFDVLNPKVRKNFRGKGNYLIFKCKLIEGFEQYNKELNYEVFFSLPSFRRAWLRAKRNYVKLDLDKMYDCVITFMRPHRKKMEILDLDIIEIVFEEEDEHDFV